MPHCGKLFFIILVWIWALNTPIYLKKKWCWFDADGIQERYQRELQERQTGAADWEIKEEWGNDRSEHIEGRGWEKPDPRLKIKKKKKNLRANILDIVGN